MKRKKTRPNIVCDLGVPIFFIGSRVPSLLQDAAPDGVGWIHAYPETIKKPLQSAEPVEPVEHFQAWSGFLEHKRFGIVGGDRWKYAWPLAHSDTFF